MMWLRNLFRRFLSIFFKSEKEKRLEEEFEEVKKKATNCIGSIKRAQDELLKIQKNLHINHNEVKKPELRAS